LLSVPTGLDLAGLDVAGLDVAGLDFAGLDVAGLDFAGLDLAGLDLAGLDFAGLGLAGLDLAGLGLAGLGLSETRRSPDEGIPCTFMVSFSRVHKDSLVPFADIPNSDTKAIKIGLGKLLHFLPSTTTCEDVIFTLTDVGIFATARFCVLDDLDVLDTFISFATSLTFAKEAFAMSYTLFNSFTDFAPKISTRPYGETVIVGKSVVLGFRVDLITNGPPW